MSTNLVFFDDDSIAGAIILTNFGLLFDDRPLSDPSLSLSPTHPHTQTHARTLLEMNSFSVFLTCFWDEAQSAKLQAN